MFPPCFPVKSTTDTAPLRCPRAQCSASSCPHGAPGVGHPPGSAPQSSMSLKALPMIHIDT